MLVPFICTDCGQSGSASVESEADIPPCLHCGRKLAVDRGSDEELAIVRAQLADEIVSWVTQPLETPEADSGSEMICPDCGYAGAMPFDPDHEGVICPACMAVHRRKRPPGYRIVECPGCGGTVEYSDLDRGKTIICVTCKYFLGCLVPPEKHGYRTDRAVRFS